MKKMAFNLSKSYEFDISDETSKDLEYINLLTNFYGNNTEIETINIDLPFYLSSEINIVHFMNIIQNIDCDYDDIYDDIYDIIMISDFLNWKKFSFWIEKLLNNENFIKKINENNEKYKNFLEWLFVSDYFENFIKNLTNYDIYSSIVNDDDIKIIINNNNTQICKNKKIDNVIKICKLFNIEVYHQTNNNEIIYFLQNKINYYLGFELPFSEKFMIAGGSLIACLDESTVTELTDVDIWILEKDKNVIHEIFEKLNGSKKYYTIISNNFIRIILQDSKIKQMQIMISKEKSFFDIINIFDMNVCKMYLSANKFIFNIEGLLSVYTKKICTKKTIQNWRIVKYMLKGFEIDGLDYDGKTKTEHIGFLYNSLFEYEKKKLMPIINITDNVTKTGIDMLDIDYCKRSLSFQYNVSARNIHHCTEYDKISSLLSNDKTNNCDNEYDFKFTNNETECIKLNKYTKINYVCKIIDYYTLRDYYMKTFATNLPKLSVRMNANIVFYNNIKYHMHEQNYLRIYPTDANLCENLYQFSKHIDVNVHDYVEKDRIFRLKPQNFEHYLLIKRHKTEHEYGKYYIPFKIKKECNLFDCFTNLDKNYVKIINAYINVQFAVHVYGISYGKYYSIYQVNKIEDFVIYSKPQFFS